MANCYTRFYFAFPITQLESAWLSQAVLALQRVVDGDASHAETCKTMLTYFRGATEEEIYTLPTIDIRTGDDMQVACVYSDGGEADLETTCRLLTSFLRDNTAVCTERSLYFEYANTMDRDRLGAHSGGAVRIDPQGWYLVSTSSTAVRTLLDGMCETEMRR